MAMMHRSSWGIGRFKPLHAAAVVYVEVIRGTPILLQLYFFYFMLPQWFPALDLSEFTCVMIACCVNSTAYVCEIVRAGIQAVDAGQTEAARSLGLNSRQAMIDVYKRQLSSMTFMQTFVQILLWRTRLSTSLTGVRINCRMMSVGSTEPLLPEMPTTPGFST